MVRLPAPADGRGAVTRIEDLPTAPGWTEERARETKEFLERHVATSRATGLAVLASVAGALAHALTGERYELLRQALVAPVALALGGAVLLIIPTRTRSMVPRLTMLRTASLARAAAAYLKESRRIGVMQAVGFALASVAVLIWSPASAPWLIPFLPLAYMDWRSFRPHIAPLAERAAQLERVEAVEQGSPPA